MANPVITNVDPHQIELGDNLYKTVTLVQRAGDNYLAGSVISQDGSLCTGTTGTDIADSARYVLPYEVDAKSGTASAKVISAGKVRADRLFFAGADNSTGVVAPQTALEVVVGPNATFDTGGGRRQTNREHLADYFLIAVDRVSSLHIQDNQP